MRGNVQAAWSTDPTFAVLSASTTVTVIDPTLPVKVLAEGLLATIDNHEVMNDFAGGAPAASDPRFPENAGLINETELFRDGLQASQE